MSDENEGENDLFAGGFKGKCRNCGKPGHKSRGYRAQGGGSYTGEDGGNKIPYADIECYVSMRPRVISTHSLRHLDIPVAHNSSRL